MLKEGLGLRLETRLLKGACHANRWYTGFGWKVHGMVHGKRCIIILYKNDFLLTWHYNKESNLMVDKIVTNRWTDASERDYSKNTVFTAHILHLVSLC